MANYRGDDDSNSYSGTNADDLIEGLGGDDILRGAAGNDTIYGGDGDDFLYGQGGDDFLYGGAGDDILRSGAGVDRFAGGDGFDRVSLLSQGADGSPTHGVIVDLERQLILDDGFGNRERLFSIEALGATLPFADILRGSAGNNLLWGGVGDTVLGFGGDDQILMDGVAGARIDGGEGRDELSLAASSRFVFDTNGGLQDELASTGVIIDLSRGRVIADGFGGAAVIRGIEDAIGNDLDSRLTGNDEANRLQGLRGDDRLSGLGGDDTLVGGTGRDILTGGAGADHFVFSGFASLGMYFDYSSGGTVVVYPIANPDSGATFSTADVITDFNKAEGDVIDLSAVDAIYLADNGSPLDDAFTWLGTGRFTGAAGEARYEVRGANTFILLEVNGEAGADMVIRLNGVHDLTASDFLL